MPVKRERETRRSLIKDFRRNKVLYFMMIPAVVYWIIFKYVPMGGVIIAFKRFRYDLGILRSPWVGLQNFKFFLGNDIFGRLVFMTIMYNLAFMFTGLVLTVGLALVLSEVGNRYFKKISHSLIFLPYFVSMVVVSSISYALFNNTSGMLQGLVKELGSDFNFYATASIWKYILVFIVNWKGIGYGSIVYLAVITGIDPELHESARMDGATVWQRMGYISLPMLRPTIILLTIMGLSGILAGGGELFFQIIGNNVMVHRYADTIESYIYRSLLSPGSNINYAQTAALGLFQQFCGFILIMVVNTIVKYVSPEHAIF